MRPLVIIPTYNERDNLPVVVERLLSQADMRILVVDDGSPDGTGAVADGLAAASGGRLTVLHRNGARGLGRSYVDGMQRALTTDATHVCQMDADLAIGSRYVPGGVVRNWAVHRMLLSAFANRYVRAITRLPVHDCTSGFRCWRRELLARLPLSTIVSDGYAFQVEMAWNAFRAGGRIAEVPITFVERARGTSKLSSRVIIESVLLPWQLVARPRTR